MNGKQQKQPPGFTLWELLVVIFIIGILLVFLIPSAQRGREAARRMQCSSNMKMIGFALHAYHDTYQTFPTAMLGNDHLSGIIALLPELEQEALYAEIYRADHAGSLASPPPAWDETFRPWQTELDVLDCPSAWNASSAVFGLTNYAFNIGDVATNIHRLESARGAFAPGLYTGIKDFTDGTSDTIALTEIGTANQRTLPGQYAINQPMPSLFHPDSIWKIADEDAERNCWQTYLANVSLHPQGRGYNWADGSAGPGLVNTILPPNAPSIAVGGEVAVDGFYSAGSYHPGGAQVLLVDASTRFIAKESTPVTKPWPRPARPTSATKTSPALTVCGVPWAAVLAEMSQMINKHRYPAGFTIRDLMMLTFLVAAFLFCCAPLINMGHREGSRRMRCVNNLKQLMLAMHNYHDTYHHFPAAMGGTGNAGSEFVGDANRLSGVVMLLPFLEQVALYEQITNPVTSQGNTYPPPPWDKSFMPWQEQLNYLTCPTAPRVESLFGRTNYAFCIGDVASDIHHLEVARGASAPGLCIGFHEITDGTSNTIMLAEIGSPDWRYVPGNYAINIPAVVLEDPSRCLKVLDESKPKNNKNRTYRRDIPLHDLGRGYCWADGCAGPGLVNTILPPNSPSCAVLGTEAVDGIYSAGSYHPGGVQVGFADGSVRFVAETIDTADLTQPPPKREDFQEKAFPSPYGVWGALGSRSSGEVIPLDF